MQVFPALPWDGPVNGGEIKLQQAVTLQNLLNGDVVVIITNGDTYLEAKFSGGGQLRLDYIPQEGGEAVKMYDAELSADGKTIVLTNPQSPANYWFLFDVIKRDGIKLYPSFPLQHGNSGLLILPRPMTMEVIQASLFPVVANVSHDNELSVGAWDIYPSDSKLYIVSKWDGLAFKVANVNTETASGTYTSLNLIPYNYNVSVDLVDVIETPSAPVMVPDAPWDASIEAGDVILPEPLTFDDIVNGALVFATDYELDGTHYDHFSIVNQGTSITLQIGVNRAFELDSWEGSKSVIRLGRQSVYEPAPLTAVSLTPAIPAEGAVQIFKDAKCTEYASGVVNKVYMRTNIDFGPGQSETWGHLDAGSALQIACKPDYDKYFAYLWIDFIKDEFDGPFEAGKVYVAALPNEEELDVSSFDKIFPIK